MDSTNLILTEPISPPTPLENSGGVPFSEQAGRLDAGNIKTLSEDKKIQAAKDFESVLVNKLLEKMEDTIGDWGFEKDGASKQVHGIFWLYLSQHIANNGGFGLWKDIYNVLTNSDQTKTTTEQSGQDPILL
jgi:Rod binding domain-containing protein